MTIKREISELSFRPDVSTTPESTESLTWRYECSLSPHHIDAVLFPTIPQGDPDSRFESWRRHLDTTPDKVGYLTDWIKSAIHQMPAGVDVARDVDGGGYTRDDVVDPCMFTPWVDLGAGNYGRFAEARTAMHHTMVTQRGVVTGGALRSPVMGGVALEVTSNPASLDPRDAVTFAIFGFTRKKDARYPWLHPRAGEIFDMTPFSEQPYTVGPLYDGHPNKVKDPKTQERAVDAALKVLEYTYQP